MSRPTRAETVAWLAADTLLMEQDLASGMVPHGVTRPLFSHEVHTNFAEIEADVDRTAAALAASLQADRQAFIDLLAADLAAVARNPGPQPVAVAVAARLLQLHTSLGLAAIAGVTGLIADQEQRYRQALAQAALAGGRRVVDEAARMGVDTADIVPKLAGLDEYRLDLAAQRLAQTPHMAVVDAAATAAYQLPGMPAADLVSDVVDRVRQLSPDPLLTVVARPAVQQAEGLGRQAAMLVLPAAKRYYSSELLDRSTCSPCQHVDGTEYATLADARVDYPTGGYRDCQGGDRCRGTVVAVWATEQGFGE